jgi:glycosyltransferase involved in cell wall biosynthesis
MKVSVITVAYNAGRTIADTLRSVAEQTYANVEHIVVDGASIDNTAALVKLYQRQGGLFVSEPDKGLYDAMNKGIALATGDVIGILNADDFYAEATTLSQIVESFSMGAVDAVLGDIGYFHEGSPNRIVRRFNSGRFRPERMKWGWMPAHPGAFFTRESYIKVGNYRTDYRISADFEFMLRAFVKHNLTYLYLPEVLVRMRMGGVSTSGLGAAWTNNLECIRACRENGVQSNLLMFMSRYPMKTVELLCRFSR